MGQVPEVQVVGTATISILFYFYIIITNPVTEHFAHIHIYYCVMAMPVLKALYLGWLLARILDLLVTGLDRLLAMYQKSKGPILR